MRLARWTIKGAVHPTAVETAARRSAVLPGAVEDAAE